MQPSSEFDAAPETHDNSGPRSARRVANAAPHGLAVPSRLSRLFCMLVPLSFGCGDKPQTPPETPSATARCDLAQLQTSATELASKRAAWDADAPLDQGREANDALRRACVAEFLDPYAQVLDETMDDRHGYPLYLKPTYVTTRACPSAEEVATSAPTKPAAERPGYIYDACEFERYSAVISRDSFVTLNGSTGAAALFELGEALQAEGLAEDSSNLLIRELVLQSGSTSPPPVDAVEP